VALKHLDTGAHVVLIHRTSLGQAPYKCAQSWTCSV